MDFAIANWLPIVAFVMAIISFIYVPLPGQLNSVSVILSLTIPVISKQREGVTDFFLFAIYWVSLGIASSVGLGTGLHTFILYLGPHIAQVVMASNECNAVPTMMPSRWKFDHFAPCDSVPAD